SPARVLAEDTIWRVEDSNFMELLIMTYHLVLFQWSYHNGIAMQYEHTHKYDKIR
ncbi:hypothetical protein L9F63_001106, partial [Diploptera punctata]